MRSSPFRDAGRHVTDRKLPIVLRDYPRCPCPRVVHRACTRACASARHQGRRLSRIHKRSNAISRSRTCSPMHVHVLHSRIYMYVRMYRIVQESGHIGANQACSKEMAELIPVGQLDRYTRDIDYKPLSIDQGRMPL